MANLQAALKYIDYVLAMPSDAFGQACDNTFADISYICGWCPSQTMAVLSALTCKSLIEAEAYLEIGTFCGRSLVAALDGNDKHAFVIDPLPDTLDFFNGELFVKFNETLDMFKVRDRVTLYRVNAERFHSLNPIPWIPKVGLFFYDGNHDSGHTYEGLKDFEKYLSDQAVIIVDDYKIHGGDRQFTFPGYRTDLLLPVKTDTDRWIQKNRSKIEWTRVLPWGHHQMVIGYNRCKPGMRII